LIGFEALKIQNMVKGKFAKSIMDAAWGLFGNMLVYKAANAGKYAITVNPRKTSRTCPWCGKIVPKNLLERQHHCDCKPDLIIDRDQASGMIVEALAVGLAAASGVEICPAILERSNTRVICEALKGVTLAA
jgi:putative transposase